jgi:hypothetical protein
MRYMIIVMATRASEAGVMPGEDMLAKMAVYHEELARAGVLVDASGLHPSAKGWRVEYRGQHTNVIDGPFAETKELIAGFTIIRVDSEQEAREWTRRFPRPSLEGSDCHIEVRRMFELEELGASEAVERYRRIPGNGHPVSGV